MGLGIFRFVLATIVALSHLWGGMISGPGAYAVWGFYLISGYLMAYVLHHHYGFTKRGLLLFYRNRIIRIYPGYYFALIIGLITYYIVSINHIALNSLNPEFGFPSSIESLFFNATLFPGFKTNHLLVPVSIALGLEVGFYILAPIISYKRLIALIFLALTVAVNYKFQITEATFAERYSGFWCSLFSFCMGVTFYFYKHKLAFFKNPRLSIYLWAIQFNIILVNLLIPWDWGLYVSLFFTLFVLNSLCDQPINKLDLILGDMSYLIYLLHTTIGYLIIVFIPALEVRGFYYFCAAYFITLMVAYIFVAYIERPIRNSFRIS